MSIEEFLKELPDVGPWYVTPSGFIRNSKFECPICALINKHGKKYRNDQVIDVYNLLGLSKEDFKAIVKAADRTINSDLRQQLLQILCEQ